MRPADLVSLLGGFFAGISIALAVYKEVYLAIHVLFLSYAMDVLDGIVARMTGGGTKEGLLLDRALDRVSQVIAPLVIYMSWITTLNVTLTYEILISIYAGLLMGIAFWRLVYRVVWSLDYFAGLPLFVHAIVLLMAVIASMRLPVYLFYVMLTLSALPVPYLRRISSRSTPSPGASLRLLLALLMALIPYDLSYVKILAKVLIFTMIVYIALGPIPPLLGITPSPKSGGKPQTYDA